MSTTAEISPEVLYALTEVESRLGWKRSAIRAARRNGLTVRYIAGRGYILGADFIDYVVRNGKLDPSEKRDLDAAEI